ncbi:MAG: efflux RND transporter periplasmic adaptor subunit [Calditrichaeota bacterium]|nr:MAG: efflux RND transporter periplasmic adaptor subunit [Calditrichota bacterium]
MKKIILIITVLLVSIALVSCSGNEAKETELAKPAIAVKAELVKTETIEMKKNYTGSLKGEKQTTVYAKVSEAVESIDVREGDEVKANQKILLLDKTGPSSNYLQTRELYLNAKKQYEKMEYLYKEGAVSELDFDAAETDYKVKKASYDAASRLVEIESPIAGVVTSIDVSEGDFVQVGQKLATVANSEKLRVTFEVNPNEIASMKIGAKVSVLNEKTNSKTSGKISAIASSADPISRAFKVEAILENISKDLKPGMFVRIEYVAEILNDVIVIPRKAVQIRNEQDMVFVAFNGMAYLKAVELGADNNGDIVVLSGLQKSDTLITIGQEYLDDSTEIRITEIN